MDQDTTAPSKPASASKSRGSSLRASKANIQSVKQSQDLLTKTASAKSLKASRAGSRAALGSQKSLLSKNGSKRASQAVLPPVQDQTNPSTADGDQQVPASDSQPATQSSDLQLDPNHSQPESSAVAADQNQPGTSETELETMNRLQSSLTEITNLLQTQSDELQEVGDEIQVVPQVARTLQSPYLSAAEILDQGFTFVNVDYTLDLEDTVVTALGDTVSAVLSLVPPAQRLFMRTSSFEAMIDSSAVVDLSNPVKIRTPIMRPTSPTYVEPAKEDEKAQATIPESGLDDSAVEAMAAEGIDREALITSIKNQLDLKEKHKSKNMFLQNKLGEYFKRKRTDETHDGEKSVADQEQRYTNYMASLATLRTEYETLNSSNQKIVNEYKLKLEEHTTEALAKSDEFIKFKRGIALSAENSRTGKGIPSKTVAQLEATDQRKDMEVVAVRLDHIKLRNKLKRHEQLLRQKEELADGLHLIDFEQLKIENQTYNEKIEERNEELLKLRKKITNIVQVLTHVKEKLQFVQAENGELRKELKTLDIDVAIRRDSLPASKQSRDAIKTLNLSMRQKNGLLGNKPLLRDFEEKTDETDSLKARIDELRTVHANLSAETLAVKRQIQRKLIV